MQSWECGVTKRVPKCTKHLYICMCICVIKESLKLASVLGVTTIRPLSCEQMQVLKTRKTNFSQFRCRIFSLLALSAITLKMFDCLQIIFLGDSILSQWQVLFHSWILLQPEVYERKKLYHKLSLIFLSAIRAKQRL